RTATTTPTRKKNRKSSVTMKVALGISGGIACYKSAEIVRRLQDRGVDVTVLMTKGATQFVTPLTFRALSGNKVYVDIFEGQRSGSGTNGVQDLWSGPPRARRGDRRLCDGDSESNPRSRRTQSAGHCRPDNRGYRSRSIHQQQIIRQDGLCHRSCCAEPWRTSCAGLGSRRP